MALAVLHVPSLLDSESVLRRLEGSGFRVQGSGSGFGFEFTHRPTRPAQAPPVTEQGGKVRPTFLAKKGGEMQTRFLAILQTSFLARGVRRKPLFLPGV